MSQRCQSRGTLSRSLTAADNSVADRSTLSLSPFQPTLYHKEKKTLHQPPILPLPEYRGKPRALCFFFFCRAHGCGGLALTGQTLGGNRGRRYQGLCCVSGAADGPFLGSSVGGWSIAAPPLPLGCGRHSGMRHTANHGLMADHHWWLVDWKLFVSWVAYNSTEGTFGKLPPPGGGCAPRVVPLFGPRLSCLPNPMPSLPPK